jgi:hypothetical protein
MQIKNAILQDAVVASVSEALHVSARAYPPKPFVPRVIGPVSGQVPLTARGTNGVLFGMRAHALTEHPHENRIDMFEMIAEIEFILDFGHAQPPHNFGVTFQQVEQRQCAV